MTAKFYERGMRVGGKRGRVMNVIPSFILTHPQANESDMCVYTSTLYVVAMVTYIFVPCHVHTFV